MEFFSSYALFIAKILTVTVIFMIVSVSIWPKGAKRKAKGKLSVTNLSELHKEHANELKRHLFDEATMDAMDKSERERRKAQAKSEKLHVKSLEDLDSATHKPHLFVLNFKGDLYANAVESLRHEVTAILSTAKETDEVLLKLESGGGTVVGYGLAAAQLRRLREANLKLTVCVDKVAASGGYMMACTASHLVSAPFAMLGSIGVISEVPNVNKLLKKLGVEYEQVTAGEYKRTLTVFGENTEQGRAKFKQELEAIHDLFKDMISTNRPLLDIETIATGECWFGKKAKELKLVDEINTSDDIIAKACTEKTVLLVEYTKGKRLSERLAKAAVTTSETIATKLAEHAHPYR